MKNYSLFQKTMVASLMLLLFSTFSFSQSIPIPQSAPSEKAQHAYCGHSELEHSNMKVHPEVFSKYKNKNEDEAKMMVCPPTGDIPVVFHIMTDAEKFSCFESPYTVDDLTCSIEALNDYFPVPNITFRLAEKDDAGVAFSGITRRKDPNAINAFDSNALPNLDWSEELAAFPPDKYLNIWVVQSVNGGGSSGLAFYPETAVGYGDYYNAVLMDKKAMCGHPDYDPQFHGTLVHEIGHWLGLRHVWSSGYSSIGDPINCLTDDQDFVHATDLNEGPGLTSNPYQTINWCGCNGADTNNMDTWTWPTSGYNGPCSTYNNTCEDDSAFPYDGYANNFMDYTVCDDKQFTEWQICLMTSVLGDADFGRASLLNADAFCNGGCPAAVDPEEHTFIEASSNQGIIINKSIIVHLEYTSINSNSNINITNDLIVNSSPIDYGPDLEAIYIAADNVIQLSFNNQLANHLVDQSFTVDFSNVAFTTPVTNAIQTFNLDFVNAPSACDITYGDFRFNQLVSSGYNNLPSRHPLFQTEIFFDLTYNSNGSFSFTVDSRSNYIPDSTVLLASQSGNFNLPMGTVIGNNLAYNVSTVNFTPTFDGQLFMYGFRVGICGEEYFSWIRFVAYETSCGDYSVGYLDAAGNAIPSSPINAGQSVCDCTGCNGVLASNIDAFVESELQANQYEPIYIYYETSGCGAFPTPMFSGALASHVTHSINGNVLTINYDGQGSPSGVLEVDFNVDNCILKDEFSFEVAPYSTGTTCEAIDQILTSDVRLTFSTPDISNANPAYSLETYLDFLVDPVSREYGIGSGSWFTIYIPSTDPIVQPAGVPVQNYNTVVPVGGEVPFINSFNYQDFENKENYLPISLEFGCNDLRQGYIHFTIDCDGALHLYDIVISNSPHTTLGTIVTGDQHCFTHPSSYPVCPPTCITAILSNTDPVTTMSADGLSATTTFNITASNTTSYTIIATAPSIGTITDSNTTGSFSISTDHCELLEYEIQAVCSNGLINVLEEGSIQIPCECSAVPVTITETYDPSTSSAIITLYTPFASNYTINVDGQNYESQDGVFTLPLAECGEFLYQYYTTCVDGSYAAWEWETYDADCTPGACSSDNAVVTHEYNGGSTGTITISATNVENYMLFINGTYYDSVDGIFTIPVDNCDPFQYQYNLKCLDGSYAGWTWGTFDPECTIDTCTTDDATISTNYDGGSTGTITISATNVSNYIVYFDGNYYYSTDGVFTIPVDDCDEFLFQYSLQCLDGTYTGWVWQTFDPDCVITTCTTDDATISTNYDGGSTGTITISATNVSNYIVYFDGNYYYSTDGVFTIPVDDCDEFLFQYSLQCLDGTYTGWVWQTFDPDCVITTCTTDDATISTNYDGGSTGTITISAANVSNYTVYFNGTYYDSADGLFTIPVDDCEEFLYQYTLTCLDGSYSGWVWQTFDPDCVITTCTTDDATISTNYDGGSTGTISISAANVSNYTVYFNGTYYDSADGLFTIPVDDCEEFLYQYTLTCLDGSYSGWVWQTFDPACNSIALPCTTDNATITSSYDGGTTGTITISAVNVSKYTIYINSTYYNSENGVFTIPVNNCDPIQFQFMLTCNDGTYANWTWATFEDPNCRGANGNHMAGSNTEEELGKFKSSSLTVFPNPFDQKLQFTFENNQDAKVIIELYNAMGTLVISEEVFRPVGSANFEINNDLPSGAYYYRIQFNEKWHTGKVMKVSKR